jgi:hypothetical protein
MPLPSLPESDEFASPKKARKSLDPITIMSSAASEEELDDMKMKYEWEQQRANRAHDRAEFLEMECRLKCCESRIIRDATSGPIFLTPSTSQEQAPRSSTVFIPAEGVFRTISPTPEEPPWISPAKKETPVEPPTPEQRQPASYARTPSCEPPSMAVISEANTSLLSLLDGPHSPSIPSSPTVPSQPEPAPEDEETEAEVTVIQTFHTISTTTRIPLADAPDLKPKLTLPADFSNPALSPTMSREEALAQIRERRGRARSLAQGTMTPRKQMVEGTNRRDISAPAIKSGNVRGRSQARV